MPIRIITDSAADIRPPYEDNLTVLPMTITMGDKQYQDGVTLDHRRFYELLIECDELPKTSQLPPAWFEDAFRAAVQAGETVVAVVLSSKLSGTYQSACVAAEGFPGRVWVVDSENAAIGEQILVRRALQLVAQGMGAEELAGQLNREKKDIRLIALLDTLEYLKRGGRLSASTAMIGGLLSIKPVISIRDGEVQLLGRARGSRNGNNFLLQEIERTNGIDFERPYCLGYTGLSDGLLRKYMEDSASLWKDCADRLPIVSIGCTVGTHTGPGAIAVAFFQKPSSPAP